jgi:hypothetical protein
MYTEEYLYIPINQLHRGGKRVYTEELAIYIYIYMNRWVTQRSTYTMTHMMLFSAKESMIP